MAVGMGTYHDQRCCPHTHFLNFHRPAPTIPRQGQTFPVFNPELKRGKAVSLIPLLLPQK